MIAKGWLGQWLERKSRKSRKLIITLCSGGMMLSVGRSLLLQVWLVGLTLPVLGSGHLLIS
jgi:hypothetical protein